MGLQVLSLMKGAVYTVISGSDSFTFEGRAMRQTELRWRQGRNASGTPQKDVRGTTVDNGEG